MKTRQKGMNRAKVRRRELGRQKRRGGIAGVIARERERRHEADAAQAAALIERLEQELAGAGEEE